MYPPDRIPARSAIARLATTGLAAATALAGLAVLAPEARAATATTFTPGELVVDRIGTGSATLSSSATPVFLDQYPTSGASSTPDFTVALPTTASGSNQALTNSGSAGSEGALSLSGDGRYLALGGYAAAPGTSSVASTSASSVNRVVGIVDGDGAVNTATHLGDAYTGNNIRGAVTSDGSRIWTDGNGTSTDGGVRTSTKGATTSTTVNDQSQAGASNQRTLQIVGGQLYTSNGSGNIGVAKVGTGLPTSSGNPVSSIAPQSSAYGFVLLDENPDVTGADTLYVGDQSASTSLQKYTLGSNGTWTSRGTAAVGSGITGLTGTYANGTATLYATVGTGAGNQLVTFTDRAAQTAAPSPSPISVLATAAANTVFRGLAFAPSPGAPAQSAPIITTQPSDQTIENGSTATLSVTTSGTPAPTYQWYVGRTGDTASPVSGATSASYTTPALTSTTSYWVRVSNAAGSVDSRTATVTVNPPANTSPTISTPAPLSGAQGDPTNPVTTVSVGDAETPASDLTVTATASTNDAVASASDVTVRGSGSTRTLAVSPQGRGYADLTLTVTDGDGLTASSTLRYASSGPSPTSTRWITGATDPSTEIAVGDGYALVADDEDQKLRLYDTTRSGAPTASFDYTAMLGLTDTSGGVPKEVDIEAATRVGDTIYWFGSQSNSSSFNAKPNRDRVFATTVSGSGAGTTLSFVGFYKYLREDLIAWDKADGDRFGLAASAAAGVDPKQADGYNIEGFEMAPGTDGGLSTSTGYLAFRAPLEPTSARTKALLVPLTDLPSLISSTGGTQGTATFGDAILQDLGGNGVREIRANADGQYVEVAGPPGSGGASTESLYTWDGRPGHAPVLRSADLTGPGSAGPYEGVLAVPEPLTAGSTLGLVADSGSVDLYGNGSEAKDLTTAGFRKSRIDQVELGAAVTADSTTTVTNPLPTPAAGESAPVAVSVASADPGRTPSGTVSVTDLGDGTGTPVDLGSASLVADGTTGEATATLSATFDRGTHRLRATYVPDAASLVSDSRGTASAFTVVPSTTTGAPTFDPARPTYHQDVVVTVPVSTSDGSGAAGAVQLYDDAENALGEPTNVSHGSAVVVVPAGTFEIGTTEVHGEFTGATADDGLADWPSSGTAATLTVVSSDTTTGAPRFDPARPTYGEDVTVTVAVTAGDGFEPSGTVQLFDDHDVAVGSATTLDHGTAIFAEPAGTFSIGDTVVHAVFSPDDEGYTASTGDPATVTVAPADTATTIVTRGAEETFATPVSVTVTSSPRAGAPRGFVSIRDGSGSQSRTLCTLALKGGRAAVPASCLPPAEYRLVADYTPSGDTTAASSSDPVDYTVTRAAPALTESFQPQGETAPSKKARVLASVRGVRGAPAPTGSVTFSWTRQADTASGPLCSLPLNRGGRTKPCALKTLPPGTYRVTATYQGDANYGTASVTGSITLS